MSHIRRITDRYSEPTVPRGVPVEQESESIGAWAAILCDYEDEKRKPTFTERVKQWWAKLTA